MNTRKCPSFKPNQIAFFLLAIPWVANQVEAQTQVGEIASNFTINDRATGEPIQLYDFEGEILVLDFWAYWCGPCRTSSPDLELNVNQYYRQRNGNANGIPVTVLPVNIESRHPQETERFISEFGLGRVAEDFGYNQAYGQFETGYIPLFVIINGVQGSPGFQQWEVLFRNSGYPGAQTLRRLIDEVKPPTSNAPASIIQPPTDTAVKKGETVVLTVTASGSPPLHYQWFFNGTPIPGATASVLEISNANESHGGLYTVRVSNAFNSASSNPAQLTIRDIGLIKTYTNNTSALIPDAEGRGINSTLQVSEDQVILSVRLKVLADHSYAGDLSITLTSPSGTEWIARESNIQNNEPNFQLDLETAAFNDESSSGTWILNIADNYEEDTGSLKTWSLLIEGLASIEQPVVPPTISFRMANHSELELIWNDVSNHWILQTAPSLNGSWTDFGVQPQAPENGQCVARASVNQSARFFRLRKPE